jgi:hypothetical protein
VLTCTASQSTADPLRTYTRNIFRLVLQSPHTTPFATPSPHLLTTPSAPPSPYLHHTSYLSPHTPRRCYEGVFLINKIPRTCVLYSMIDTVKLMLVDGSLFNYSVLVWLDASLSSFSFPLLNNDIIIESIIITVIMHFISLCENYFLLYVDIISSTFIGFVYNCVVIRSFLKPCLLHTESILDFKAFMQCCSASFS